MGAESTNYQVPKTPSSAYVDKTLNGIEPVDPPIE